MPQLALCSLAKCGKDHVNFRASWRVDSTDNVFRKSSPLLDNTRVRSDHLVRNQWNVQSLNSFLFARACLSVPQRSTAGIAEQPKERGIAWLESHNQSPAASWTFWRGEIIITITSQNTIFDPDAMQLQNTSCQHALGSSFLGQYRDLQILFAFCRLIYSSTLFVRLTWGESTSALGNVFRHRTSVSFP